MYPATLVQIKAKALIVAMHQFSFHRSPPKNRHYQQISSLAKFTTVPEAIEVLQGRISDRHTYSEKLSLRCFGGELCEDGFHSLRRLAPGSPEVHYHQTTLFRHCIVQVLLGTRIPYDPGHLHYSCLDAKFTQSLQKFCMTLYCKLTLDKSTTAPPLKPHTKDLTNKMKTPNHFQTLLP